MPVDDVIAALRRTYGDGWGKDEEANLRFSADAEHMLRELEGAHLIGEPELDDDGVTLRLWVDFPLRDLMTADRLAYEVFARISEDVFYTERHFDAKTVRYPFVTGSTHHGHVGALVLDGPHAAEFADRHHARLAGGMRYQA